MKMLGFQKIRSRTRTTMKNRLRTAARIFVVVLIFEAIPPIIKKHLTHDIGIFMSIIAATVAALMEAAFFRYFKSEYGCTSWTLCHRRTPIVRTDSAPANKPAAQALIKKIFISNTLQNAISLAMVTFLAFITITGVSESINKILAIKMTGNVNLAAVIVSAFLAPAFFKNYQSFGEAS